MLYPLFKREASRLAALRKLVIEGFACAFAPRAGGRLNSENGERIFVRTLAVAVIP